MFFNIVGLNLLRVGLLRNFFKLIQFFHKRRHKSGAHKNIRGNDIENEKKRKNTAKDDPETLPTALLLFFIA